MLIPANISTAATRLLPGKTLQNSEGPTFLHPDFFKPIDKGAGFSYTYHDTFYAAFTDHPNATQDNAMAMLVLHYLTIDDMARLPLFPGASLVYMSLVIAAINNKLTSTAEDSESLATKFHIVNCGIHMGYLQKKMFYNLRFANLMSVMFIGMDLSNIDFSGVNFKYADVMYCNLSGAHLLCADLSAADFTGSNLTDANLRDANLTDANLSGADLRRANLIRTNLTRTNLTNTELI